jgi:3-oxoadipate enol-lactonase
MWTTRDIPVNGTQLHVAQDGTGMPVVLIHGMTLNYRMWEPQRAALAATYRVIAYDVRGFGQSADPQPGATPGTWESYDDREDLSALFAELEVTSAHVVGLSRGGRVALDFAIHHGNKVRSLTLIGCTPRFTDDSIPRNPVTDAIRRNVVDLVRAGKRDAACEKWLEAPLWTTPAGGIDPEVERIVRDYFRGPHEFEATPPTRINKDALAGIHAPALILIADHDSEEMQQSAIALNAGLPNSELHTVPNAGHITNIDQPDIVNQALLAFLKDCA